ncbi:MAG: hypothetical protein AAF184_03950 [Pseudomonadota bacterium]
MAEGDPFPSISEAEARGETAAIYADIRHTLALAQVNLLWRSLAAIPEALPWAWGSVKPLHTSGRAAMAATSLRESLTLPQVRAIRQADLRANGLTAEDEREIVRTVASYSSANLLNAVSFAALLSMPVGEDGAVVSQLPARTEDSDPAMSGRKALPSLLPLEAMAPDTAQRVRQVSRLGCDPQAKEVQVSLPRQLAHWPAFLALWLAAFADAEQDGSLRRTVTLAVEAVQAEGARLAQGSDALAPPSDATAQARAQAVIDAIVPGPIGRMLVLVESLLSALEQR